MKKLKKKEVFSKNLLLKNLTLEEFQKLDVARSNYYGNNILMAKKDWDNQLFLRELNRHPKLLDTTNMSRTII